MEEDDRASPHLAHWQVSAELAGTGDDTAVDVLAVHPTLGQMHWHVEADWVPGEEARDVEGRVLLFMSACFTTLSKDMLAAATERIAGEG